MRLSIYTGDLISFAILMKTVKISNDPKGQSCVLFPFH